MKEYEYELYNFTPGPRRDASHSAMVARVADGWQINTCYPNYTECSVMWERELPKAEPKKARGAAPKDDAQEHG